MAANGGEGEEELVDFEGSDYGFEEGTEAELRGEDSALAGGGGGAEQEQEQEEEVEEEAGRRGVQQEDSSTAAKEVPNEGIQQLSSGTASATMVNSKNEEQEAEGIPPGHNQEVEDMQGRKRPHEKFISERQEAQPGANSVKATEDIGNGIPGNDFKRLKESAKEGEPRGGAQASPAGRSAGSSKKRLRPPPPPRYSGRRNSLFTDGPPQGGILPVPRSMLQERGSRPPAEGLNMMLWKDTSTTDGTPRTGFFPRNQRDPSWPHFSVDALERPSPFDRRNSQPSMLPMRMDGVTADRRARDGVPFHGEMRDFPLATPTMDTLRQETVEKKYVRHPRDAFLEQGVSSISSRNARMDIEGRREEDVRRKESRFSLVEQRGKTRFSAAARDFGGREFRGSRLPADEAIARKAEVDMSWRSHGGEKAHSLRMDETIYETEQLKRGLFEDRHKRAELLSSELSHKTDVHMLRKYGDEGRGLQDEGRGKRALTGDGIQYGGSNLRGDGFRSSKWHSQRGPDIREKESSFRHQQTRLPLGSEFHAAAPQWQNGKEDVSPAIPRQFEVAETGPSFTTLKENGDSARSYSRASNVTLPAPPYWKDPLLGWDNRHENLGGVGRAEWRRDSDRLMNEREIIHGSERGEWTSNAHGNIDGGRGGSAGRGREGGKRKEQERLREQVQIRTTDLMGVFGGGSVESSEWERSGGRGRGDMSRNEGRLTEMRSPVLPHLLSHRSNAPHSQRHVNCEHPAHRAQKSNGGDTRNTMQFSRLQGASRTVSVMGLLPGTPTSAVLTTFEKQGKVVNARMDDPNFFVTYASLKDAVMAKRLLDRSVVAGRQISVDFANSQGDSMAS